eukprot:2056886-Pyramimonas_sp.AAC.1
MAEAEGVSLEDITDGDGRPVLPAAKRGASCPVDHTTPTGVPFSMNACLTRSDSSASFKRTNE